MKHLQRHWRFGMVLVLVGGAASTWWWQSARANMAMMLVQEEPGFTPLDRVTHDKIRGILETIGLDRDAMIALNPTATQAEGVLSTVRTWQSSNQATLASLKNTIHEKVHAVRVLEKAIHEKVHAVHVLEKAIRTGTAGPTGQDRLALAVTDRTDAHTAYDNALAPLRTSINILLSNSQQATWAAIQTGHGQQMPIRMLALTDSQRISVSKATRTFQRRRAGAANANDRGTAATSFSSDLDSILTTGQKTVVSAYNSNYNTASANVATAIDTVMAVEEGT